METKRTVAIYARVSTEHEAQISALENQIQYYDDILERHPEWKLYDKYIDEGVTGTSVKKRRSFVRMMEDAAAGSQAALPDNAGAGRRISRFGCRGRYGAEASVPSPPAQYTFSGSVSPTGSPLSSSRHLIAACVPSQ